MANPFGQAAVGFGQGMMQGFNMKRQQALEQAYLKIAQEREARLGTLMEQQNQMLQDKTQAELDRQEREEFTEPLMRMLSANPELATHLKPGFEASQKFQTAPDVSGPEEDLLSKGDYRIMRDQSLYDAGARATGIRKEREQSDLDRTMAAIDARVDRGYNAKMAQTREQMIRSLGAKVLSRDLILPEGATVEGVVDAMLAGSTDALPLKTLKGKDAEAMTSFRTIEDEIANILELKGPDPKNPRVNTGRGMELLTAIPRWFGMEPTQRKALRANLTAIISEWVKKQTGVQYGFKELSWLTKAMPEMGTDDAQFLNDLKEFGRRVQVIKKHRLEALKAGNFDVDALDIPEVLKQYPGNVKPDRMTPAPRVVPTSTFTPSGELGVLEPVPPPGPQPLKTLRFIE